MHFLATSKSWKVFLFLLLPLWFQLGFEFVEIFAENVVNMNGLAFSLISIALTLIWIREIGSAVAMVDPVTTNARLSIFSGLCWISAASFLSLAVLSMFSADPEIFLQPENVYLRPIFFLALAMFMLCTAYTARKLQVAEKADSMSILDTLTMSLLIALPLLGVWTIQPKVQAIKK